MEYAGAHPFTAMMLKSAGTGLVSGRVFSCQVPGLLLQAVDYLSRRCPPSIFYTVFCYPIAILDSCSWIPTTSTMIGMVSLALAPAGPVELTLITVCCSLPSWPPMASFTKEANLRLAKCPLKTIGDNLVVADFTVGRDRSQWVLILSMLRPAFTPRNILRYSHNWSASMGLLHCCLREASESIVAAIWKSGFMQPPSFSYWPSTHDPSFKMDWRQLTGITRQQPATSWQVFEDVYHAAIYT